MLVDEAPGEVLRGQFPRVRRHGDPGRRAVDPGVGPDLHPRRVGEPGEQPRVPAEVVGRALQQPPAAERVRLLELRPRRREDFVGVVAARAQDASEVDEDVLVDEDAVLDGDS